MLLPAFRKVDGVPIEDAQINKWAKDSIKYLLDNPGEHFAYAISGDSMVIAMRLEGEGAIEVIDCKRRHQMLIDDPYQKNGEMLK
jgi:hypothetical protein